MKYKRLCIFPQPKGVGGMVSFQARLANGLRERGWDICYIPEDTPYDALLVIGGTRHINRLNKVRKRGIMVVQRLNGMNWLHRKRNTGIRHFLRAEIGNWILAIIRARIATHIVYQSKFSQEWWERVYHSARAATTIIYNAVDLRQFSPQGNRNDLPEKSVRILMVEGTLGGGYELGMEGAVKLMEGLRNKWGKDLELVVAGRVAEADQQHWNQTTDVPIRWMGLLQPDEIPMMDRSAHLLYAADLNPACPNSVIEAMACGLPVVAFATGALPELVKNGAGRLADYGGNPWRLDIPNITGLVNAATDILADLPTYRKSARIHAETAFDLEHMLDAYINVFNEI